jgi:hypothetical protein
MSSYRPGQGRRKAGSYRISKNRAAWADTFITKLALMRYTEEEMTKAEQRLPGDEGEYGDTYRLMISTTSGRPYTLNLTAMTHDEFVAVSNLLKLALRLVEPIIVERDRRAAEAYEHGDDSLSRTYRQLPQFVIREGALGEYDESVLHGLEHALTRPPGINDPRRPVRESSPGVAESLPEDSESEDDGEETD